MKKIYLVDASAYLFRAYYALPPMQNPKGEATQALYGFIRAMLKLMKDFDPSHLAIVFDARDNKKKRSEIYADYKAQRTGIPEDLPHQINLAKEFSNLMGFPVLEVPEVEADDTMGSVARWAAQEDSEVYLCSGDKDLCQLVNGKIFVLQTHKDNKVVDASAVEEQFGVGPDKLVDWLAITGDASDNVPGLPGFGPKTATKLLQEFGDLDNLLANPTEVSGKKKQETLKEHADLARLSRQLVTIDTAVEFPKEKDFFQYCPPIDRSDLLTFLENMGFKTLVKEFSTADTPEVEQKPAVESYNYQLVNDEQSLEKLLAVLNQSDEICFDTETDHLHPMRARLVGIGFCVKEGEGWYLPFNGQLSADTLLEKLKVIFEDPKKGFYGHNVKYDYHVMRNHGVTIASIAFDTMLASYLLNSHNHRHGLDHLAMHYFDKAKTPIETLIGKGKKQISMDQVPLQQVSDYCCEDVDYTFRLKQTLEPELQERDLAALLQDMELPLLRILAEMERVGIFAESECLKKMSAELQKALGELQEGIFSHSGELFNLNSPKQLAEILFDKMGLPVIKKTKTGRSTNAEVLETLKAEHPIAGLLLEYRQLEKLRSTYVESLPEEINAETQRIHCSFSQSTAATGRLSCTNPNLQNIPVRTPMGRKIRGCFRPQAESNSYIAADYSQIELRIMAHISEDPGLLEAFGNNEDIHAFTAAQVFGIPLSEVSKDQRYRAKAVNFGIIYGQQAFGLARELGCSVPEASDFIKKYFSRYGKVKEFLESCKEQARKSGRATTLFGRERLIPDINSKNGPLRSAAERLAINTPIQGTAADLIKTAMIHVDKKIHESDLQGKMILQIHDELLFEVPDGEVESYSLVVKEEMENAMELKVPLLVDVAIGKNWMEC